MNDIQKAAKQAAKVVKATIVSHLCSELDKVKNTNNGTIPNGTIANLIADTKQTTQVL